jgi:hypothetical protein
MANPLELVKKMPWEVWAGLVLTVLVAWVATRQAVSAGRQSVPPGVGTPSGQPAPIVPFEGPPAPPAPVPAPGAGEPSNPPVAVLPAMPSGGNLVGGGSTIQGIYQGQAAASAGIAPNGGGGGGDNRPPSGPGGSLDFQRSVAADIGSHSATDSSGNTYTISKTYAQMSATERDDANRYAHGYSG